MKSYRQGRMWCRFCSKYTLFEQQYFSFGTGCLVTLITGFLFLPFWLLFSLADSFRPWRCQTCGGKYRWTPFRKAAAQSGPVVIVHVHSADAPPSPRAETPQPPPLPGPEMRLPAPVKPSREPINWGELFRSARAAVSRSWGSVVETYRGLPEWATPIVWGLGIAAPIVSTMVLIRALL